MSNSIDSVGQIYGHGNHRLDCYPAKYQLIQSLTRSITGILYFPSFY